MQQLFLNKIRLRKVILLDTQDCIVGNEGDVRISTDCLCCVLLLFCIEREPLFLSLIYKTSYVYYNTVMFHLATLLLCPLLCMRRMARETGDLSCDLVSLSVSYSYSLVRVAMFQHSNKATRERDVILHCPTRMGYQKLRIMSECSTPATGTV